MKLFQRIVANSVFFLNILILFLFLFRDRLEFPAWLQAFGRMHPLMLHLPIGMLVLMIALIAFKKYFEQAALNTSILFALYLTSIASAFTAFMGLVLAGEGGYDPDLLNRHMITGIGLSFLSWGLLLLAVHFPEKKKLFSSGVVITFVCLLITGHLGASITHGEDFVFQPLREKGMKEITDSTTLYEAAISPLFERKCTSCHNEKKAKGELIMTSLEKLMEGGENGLAFVAGDAKKSLMIERILLPAEHDDHMPPAGKPQLTEDEVKLLHQWIQSGADTKTAWTKFPVRDSLRLIAEPMIRATQKPAETQQYTFEFASSSTIEDLNTPFLTVAQFSANEPALKADFFLRQAFDRNKLNELSSIQEQLVVLNLANMPITDNDLKTLTQFKNLERLILNNSDITGKGLPDLAELKKLSSLSITGTKTDLGSAKNLGNMKSLKEVYIWNTSIQPSEVKELEKMFPEIHWSAGYVPAEGEVLRLTPPILVNENAVLEKDETIRLKHNLPGTLIRYTLDGSDPDTTSSPVYKEPIAIDGLVTLKTRACKDQWYSSRITQQYIFKKGISPKTAELNHEPNKDYKGEGITTVINSKKGTADNYRDIAWLGFRERPFSGIFEFENSPVRNITLSYARNISGWLMPPQSIEVWGGDKKENLKKITTTTPIQPKGEDGVRVEVIAIDLSEADRNYKFYKVVVHPVSKLPSWHQGKGQRGWIFLDEIFFN
jgi:hypothetical protein